MYFTMICRGMAFRLRKWEPVADGLRRLARKELRSARRRLRRSDSPSDEAVHEARKSIKKVRAIAGIIDTDDGRGLGRSEKRLRAVNRTLSGLRDADVMLDTLTTLRRRCPDVLSEHTSARIRRQLTTHTNELHRAALSDGTWKTVDRRLAALRKRAKRWRPIHRGFSALGSGIRKTHRLGRKALARARDRQRAADFHEWRKQIKALWYELRLLDRSGLDIRRDARALHRAETWLGDDHNLVVLCAQLAGAGAAAGRDVIDVGRLKCAAGELQRRLREEAIASVRDIYAVTPDAYLRRVRRAWNAWRRRPRARRPAVPGHVVAA
jgi:CHAD domain-containing protein